MLHGLDLFSGIGGISAALAPWVRTVAYCEADRYASAVLLSRMGGVTYMQLRSGTMCGHSKETCSHASISFSADSRARISALQARAQDWKVSEADYSTKPFDLSKSAIQTSFFSKTSLQSQPAADVLSSGRLPNSGMIVDGRFVQPPQLEPRISGSDGGFWPTPRANEKGDYQRDRGIKGKERPTLSGAVKLWPTPNARDWKDSGATQGNRKSPNLGTAIHFPTPRASDGKGARIPGSADKVRARQRTPNLQEYVSNVAGGTLSPMWVEWLMGYRIGWTELSALATAWYRSARGKRLRS